MQYRFALTVAGALFAVFGSLNVVAAAKAADYKAVRASARVEFKVNDFEFANFDRRKEVRLDEFAKFTRSDAREAQFTRFAANFDREAFCTTFARPIDRKAEFTRFTANRNWENLFTNFDRDIDRQLGFTRFAGNIDRESPFGRFQNYNRRLQRFGLFQST